MKAFKIAVPATLIALLPMMGLADSPKPKKPMAALVQDLEQLVQFKVQTKKPKVKKPKSKKPIWIDEDDDGRRDSRIRTRRRIPTRTATRTRRRIPARTAARTPRPTQARTRRRIPATTTTTTTEPGPRQPGDPRKAPRLGGLSHSEMSKETLPTAAKKPAPCGAGGGVWGLPSVRLLQTCDTSPASRVCCGRCGARFRPLQGAPRGFRRRGRYQCGGTG